MTSVTGKQKAYRYSCPPVGMPKTTPAMGHGISAERLQRESERRQSRRKLSPSRVSGKYAYTVYNGNGYDPVLNNNLGYVYFYSDTKLSIGTTFTAKGRQWEVFSLNKCKLIGMA